jgi:hypothetical protein
LDLDGNPAVDWMLVSDLDQYLVAEGDSGVFVGNR